MNLLDVSSLRKIDTFFQLLEHFVIDFAIYFKGFVEKKVVVKEA